MPSSTCSLCRGPAEARLRGASGDLAICRKCCKDRVVPFLIEALGPAEIAASMNGTPGRPSMAMLSLTAAAERLRAESRRRGKPRRGAALELSLAETAAHQEAMTRSAMAGGQQRRRLVGQAAVKEAAKAMVDRLGLGKRK